MLLFFSKKIHANAKKKFKTHQLPITLVKASKEAFRLYRLFEYRFPETEKQYIFLVKIDFYIARKKSRPDPWSF